MGLRVWLSGSGCEFMWGCVFCSVEVSVSLCRGGLRLCGWGGVLFYGG